MRRFKIFAAVAVLCLMGATAFTAGQQEAAKKGPVKIQFYESLPGHLGEVVEGMISDFNKSQNDVIVEPVFMPDYVTLAQKLQASIASNTAPALAQLTDQILWKFAGSGVLLSLDDFIAQPDFQKIKDDYVQGFIKAVTVKGHIYGLPMQRSTPVLYYRKDIFRKYGIDPSRLATWEGVREVSMELVKKGAVKYGIEPLHNPWFMVTALRANNAEWFNKDFTKATFGSPAGVKVFQFFHNLVYKDKAAYVYYGGSGWQYWKNSEEDLVNGMTAMYTGSTGDQGGNYKRAEAQGIAKEDIGLAFMPKFKGGRFSVPFGGTSGVIVKKVSEEKRKAAWKFLLWFSAPKQTAYWSEQTGYLPTRYSAQQYIDLKANPNAKIAIDQLKYAEPEPMTTVWNEIREKPLQKLIDRIYLEKDVDVQAAVAEAVKEANKIIQEQ